jgi:deferrochelatase/peroxidase EfeB
VDTGSVAQPAKQWPSWKLAPPIAPLTQGLVVNGFGDLATGRALFLEIGSPVAPEQGGGAWLRTLESVAPVTSAVPPEKSDPDAQSRATAVAFTWTGLKRMGLPDTALASFSRPFREGMLQEDRLRRLGDRRSGKWLESVLKDGPVWSANTPLRPRTDQHIGAYDVPHDDTEQHVTTPVTVHAILLLYTREEASADRWAAEVEAALKSHGVTVVHRLGLMLDVEQSGISREHFGFADGLSQPAPFDEDGAVTLERQPVRKGETVQGVPLGEFLIGYLNGHHEKAPGPVAPGDLQNVPDKRPEAAGLPAHQEAQGFYDLGLNGSYMVVRELKQDVAAFWQSMDENTAAIRRHDPQNSAHVTAEWLAERVVGRDRAGHLLCPGGRLKPDALGLPDNNFLFYSRDPHGIGCPPGSHVRRANPRDALAPTEAQRANLLAAANNHRILRRGRKFGPRIADTRIDDGEDRGLLFMCLNTDIARQFEFVQQTWLLNSDFATLFEETDPLVGPEGQMTIREGPLRRTVHVKTFIRMAGGDYFFLPSLPALRYLALL